MGQRAVILYCTEDIAAKYPSALSATDARVEIIHDSTADSQINSLIKVSSENITIYINYFPPQPLGSQNKAGGRSSILLQYDLRSKRQHPNEFSKLIQSIINTIVGLGAEIDEDTKLS